MSTAILPGANLGVLGGGQLGRMFTLAARRMGYRVTVFAPEDSTPAGQIAYREVRAPYDDLDAVDGFAREVDVVTFEFENVPSATIDAAARHAPVRPAGHLLHTTQNRRREKEALSAAGLPVARFAFIRTSTDLADAAGTVGFPSILKTADWGYDGKGQQRVADQAELAAAFEALDGAPAVLESLVRFEAEISVVGARGVEGTVALYEPVRNRHERHILDVTTTPAGLEPAVRASAHEITRSVLEAFDVVGVLCVEFFLLPGGALLINEIAPRPHNSGHITIDAHHVCQFEQQVRAICGLPFGATERRVPAAAMVNLLGDLWTEGVPNWRAALADPHAHLHLYAKTGPRPGRKMGHLTVTAGTVEDAETRARAARAALGTNQREAAWTSS